MTTQGVILTEAQKDLLVGQEIVLDWYYNPIQDINGDWYVGEVEVNVTVKTEFMFLNPSAEVQNSCISTSCLRLKSTLGALIIDSPVCLKNSLILLFA